MRSVETYKNPGRRSSSGPFFKQKNNVDFFSENKPSFFNQGSIQTKSNTPDITDWHEHEGDHVADNIHQKISPAVKVGNISPVNNTASSKNNLTIQRKCEECENDEKKEKETPVIQRMDAGSGVAAVATPISTEGITHFIVDDSVLPQPGQMQKNGFMARLKIEVCESVNRALAGTMFSSEGCPYIQSFFERYQNSSAEQIEVLIKRYCPSSARAGSATEIIQHIRIKAYASALEWLQNGEDFSNVGSIVSNATAGIGSAVNNITSGIGGLFFKENAGGAQATQSPHSVMQSLGKGSQLESGTRTKMEGAFGTTFSNVEIHTDNNAAKLSSDMNARAFTVGNHVAFNNGEHQPGTIVGDALMAHELAHVVQQQTNGDAKMNDATSNKSSYNSLEDDADQSAVNTTISLWSNEKKPGLDKLALKSMPKLKSGLKLQACKGKSRPATSSAPLIPATHGTDQRVNSGGRSLAIPDSDTAREFGYELNPSSRPAPAAPVPASPPGVTPPAPIIPPRIPWDGATGSPTETASRNAMKAELFHAFDAYLTAFRPVTVATLAKPRVQFTSSGTGASANTGVVDIANQIRNVLETRYSISLDAASSNTDQIAGRSVRIGAGTGQNIFDPYTEAGRVGLTGIADLATGIVLWLFENDTPGAAGAAGSRKFATEILANHHYFINDPGASEFRQQVAREYTAAASLIPNNRTQLIEYRITNLSETGVNGIGLLSAFTPGVNAELIKRWEIFRTGLHENIHLRTHPAFKKAGEGKDTMNEGFTEMFTVDTLNNDILPAVRSGSKEPLRHVVEGALFTPTPNVSIISNRITPRQYIDPRAQAERIRDGGTPPGGIPHTGIGEAGVRAAYFQGHVEYLGLGPDGLPLTALAAPGVKAPVHIPAGLSGLDELARICAVPRATIESANPGITDTLPASATLDGCRDHLVVDGETRANIAAQNGVSEADLARANPDIALDRATNAWPPLVAGRKILIAKH